MLKSGGVLTARGGKTSHAAVISRGEGIPAVVGAFELEIDLESRTMRVRDRVVNEEDIISIDGTTGEVILGEVKTVDQENLGLSPQLSELLSWADDIARLQVWANADTPKDARRAREFGAKGIGLCRTEHMFKGDSLFAFRQLIMASQGARRYSTLQTQLATGVDVSYEMRALEKSNTQYQEALVQLLKIQKEDFKGILREMDGLPVIIRLLDAPLHEFVEDHTKLSVDLAVAREQNLPEGEMAPLVEKIAAVDQLREQDPMLGNRGIRFGIMFPGVYEMQALAIFEAAAELQLEGFDPHPKVMLPLVSHVNEVRSMRPRIEKVAQEVMVEKGVNIDYQVGVMIETPRAALTADQMAQASEFFSFGSNDLTQFSYAYSRDDSAKSFLPAYQDAEILPADPFETVDIEGVGQLVNMAVTRGRAEKPELSIGVCGEHGGEPVSVAFWEGAGLNYVSASPFRVPVARIAAAQAVMNTAENTQ